MTFRSPFLRLTFCLTLLFQLSGMALPGFVSKANALFWEDDTESNDPKERKRRPDHFSLFDFMNDVDKDTKSREVRDLESRDNGPSVNNDARTLEIISSGILGMALGLVVANQVTSDSSDRTANLFIGGALGFGFGVGVGSLIMPRNYDVDPIAQSGFPDQRFVSLRDSLGQGSRKSLPFPAISVSLKF